MTRPARSRLAKAQLYQSGALEAVSPSLDGSIAGCTSHEQFSSSAEIE
jgi:hypothetical protein